MATFATRATGVGTRAPERRMMLIGLQLRASVCVEEAVPQQPPTCQQGPAGAAAWPLLKASGRRLAPRAVLSPIQAPPSYLVTSPAPGETQPREGGAGAGVEQEEEGVEAGGEAAPPAG